MRHSLAAAVLASGAGLLAAAGPLWAEADLSSFRPMPRPAVVEVVVAQVDEDLSRFRPPPKPADLSGVVPALTPDPAAKTGTAPEDLPKIRPPARPDFGEGKGQGKGGAKDAPVIEAKGVGAVKTPKAQKPAGTSSLRGAVCQRPEIKGKVLDPIKGPLKGCRVPDAVLVSEVAGVVLNPPATINCAQAVALSTWITQAVQPTFDNTIIALNVADSYSCRPRNNVRGNPVSVHGLGQAIDISAFVTNSGRTYTVAQNYNAKIKAVQKAGCGIFSTILGPGSDGYHEDHIHFDVADHGGRDYCR